MLPLIYSRRKREALKEAEDVYQYNNMSSKLGRQLMINFERLAGILSVKISVHTFFDAIEQFICEEIGSKRLGSQSNAQARFDDWFTRAPPLSEMELDYRIDAIELACSIGVRVSKGYKFEKDIKETIAVINARMLEAQFGYQFEDGDVIQITSNLVHQTITKPALSFLSNPAFANADYAFRSAHGKYRSGQYEHCLTDCCKALESTLKIISEERKWGISKDANMKALLSAAFEHNLIPDFLVSQFGGLRATLEGPGTMRNKRSAHGAGSASHVIPKSMAEYQLHQTAAAILFLAGLHSEQP